MSLAKTLLESFKESDGKSTGLPTPTLADSFISWEAKYYALSEDERNELHKKAWENLKQMFGGDGKNQKSKTND